MAATGGTPHDHAESDPAGPPQVRLAGVPATPEGK